MCQPIESNPAQLQLWAIACNEGHIDHLRTRVIWQNSP